MTTIQGGYTSGEPMTPQAAFHDLARRMMYIHDPDNVSAFLLSYRTYEAVGADLCVIWLDEFIKAVEKEKVDEFRRAVKKKTSERMLDFLEIWLSKYNPNFSSKETEKIMNTINERTDSAVANKFKLLLVKASTDKPEKKEKKEKKERGDKTSRSITTSSSQLRIPRSPAMSGPTAPNHDVAKFCTMVPSERELNNFTFDLLELYAPSLIAKQLTLFEWEIYKLVKPEEFLNQNWAKQQQFNVAPNITHLTEHFNRVSLWVAVTILSEEGTKNQTKALRKFVSMAYNCIEMGNFNTALEILAGLNHSSVQRLKAIWEKLPDREEHLYKNMDSLMQPRLNFRNYRKDLSSRPLPAFPQLSLVCRDFTYIYDGNPKYNPDGSINFDLPMLLYERIKEIEKYQSTPYDFPPNDKILSYFPYLIKYGDLDEDYLHNLSLKSQPSMWGATPTIIQDSEETGSENTPGDDESDSASSESGSSRYIRQHNPSRGETKTSEVDPMVPPLSPHRGSESPIRKSSSKTNTEEDDTSSAGSESSSHKKKPKKPKRPAPKPVDDASSKDEEEVSPRTNSSKEKERDARRKERRKALEAELQNRLGRNISSGQCQAVKVPAQYTATFAHAENLVAKFFSQVAHSNRGSLTIGNKRYLLIRSSSLSVDFFSSIRKTFTFSSKSKGEEFFRKLLFNFGQIIAKSDARTLARRVHLKTPLQIFSAGPVYQSYAGLGSAEISSEFDSLSSPTVNNNYTLITDYRVSCEAVSWRSAKKMYSHPCCHLLNGYLSGWASAAYGIPLVGVEILCVTKGDDVCRTLLCSPEKAKSMLKSYLTSQGYGEEIKSKVQIPSLLSAEDAGLYEVARKEMDEKQKKTLLFDKSKKLLNVSKISKEELDAKEKKLLALERKSMRYFSAIYAERHYDGHQGQVLVGEEPYVFIRGKAISKGFVELIVQMFGEQHTGSALAFAFDFLFDLSHSIGKSDYKHCIDGLTQKGRANLHPLKRMIGLKKAFSSLGWGLVRFDFRTANLVYAKEHFFLRFMVEGSFESDIWMKAKQKAHEEEEARKEVEEAAQNLAKAKGMTLEEAFRKLEKANKTATMTRSKKAALRDAAVASREKEGGEEFNLTNEVVKSPVCVMCAGFANGYLAKCFKNREDKERDLDLVVVEVACRATGHPSCEFLVCSKNMVLTSVKTYLKEKNEATFFPNVKYYNVMRGKKKGK